MSSSRWFPTPISSLAPLVRPVASTYAASRNIAYSIQYLQFLNRLLELDRQKSLGEMKMTSLMITMIFKTFIVTGVGVAEALLYHLLHSKGLLKTEEWVRVVTVKSNSFKEGNKDRLHETHVFEKLEKPREGEMSFRDMVNKAEGKKLLGPDHEVYALLKKLRTLRNNVHLMNAKEAVETDWNQFNTAEFKLMKRALWLILSGPLCSPNKKQLGYIAFLKDH